MKVGKNGGLSVKVSEKKVGSFWWHMARNPKLSAPPNISLLQRERKLLIKYSLYFIVFPNIFIVN